MAQRTLGLEINVVSSQDLEDVYLFTKMDVYVVVSISGDNSTSAKKPVLTVIQFRHPPNMELPHEIHHQ
ncbi:unnamed protein product [Rhodiola kirilowii]